MDENRLSGTAKNLGGKVEEAFGRATGNARRQAHGQMQQAEGSVQDLYGQAKGPKDAAGEAINAVNGGRLRLGMGGRIHIGICGRLPRNTHRYARTALDR
jgi:uncharacterized protein YjbJ (UPF0337 family)